MSSDPGSGFVSSVAADFDALAVVLGAGLAFGSGFTTSVLFTMADSAFGLAVVLAFASGFATSVLLTIGAASFFGADLLFVFELASAFSALGAEDLTAGEELFLVEVVLDVFAVSGLEAALFDADAPGLDDFGAEDLVEDDFEGAGALDLELELPDEAFGAEDLEPELLD